MTDDRFAILRSVRLDGPGRRLTLSEIISGDTPLADLAELAEAAAAAWAGSWSVAPPELQPAVPYPFDEEPLDAEAARALGGRIRRRLDAAAVIGGEEIAGCPAGWLRLLAAALDGLVRLSDADPSAHAIRVAQVKEKFGTGSSTSAPRGPRSCAQRFSASRDGSRSARTTVAPSPALRVCCAPAAGR